MSQLSLEQYQERMRDAIAILTIPSEEDIRLQQQIEACNKWLETPEGKEMMFKIMPVAMPYLESIMKYVGIEDKPKA